jgi:hypothetical protein
MERVCAVHLCITVPTVYIHVQYVHIYPADPVTNQFIHADNQYIPSSYSAWIRLLANLADILVPQCLPPTCPCTFSISIVS